VHEDELRRQTPRILDQDGRRACRA
jgi:hypothetical protein